MSIQSDQLKHVIFSMIKCARADLEKKFKKMGVEITPFQYTILALLKESPATLNELAKYTDNKPPTIIPALDNLEKDNYVIRHQDTQDRRKVIVTITQEGIEMLKKIQVVKKGSLLEKGLQSLGKEKSNLLLQLLEELATAIKK